MKNHFIVFIGLIFWSVSCSAQSEFERTDSLFEAMQKRVELLESQVANLSEPGPAMRGAAVPSWTPSVRASEPQLDSKRLGCSNGAVGR